MTHPRILPSGLGISFTVPHALERGVTRSRLRASDLERPVRGIRTITGAGLEEVCRALMLHLGPRMVVSHDTAAALLDMRLVDGMAPVPIHVASVGHERPPRISGIAAHRLPADAAAVERAGVRMTSPVQTWIDLTASRTVDDLIVLGDGLIRRKRPLASLDQLADAARRARGRAGAARLREALGQLRPRSDSPRETRLRLLVLRAGFPEPEVNGVVVGRRGERLGHGDLLWRGCKVIVEYDGRQHRTDLRQYRIDIERLERFMDAGWRVIRVDERVFADPSSFLASLDRALGAAV